jgi:hypothetical protein
MRAKLAIRRDSSTRQESGVLVWIFKRFAGIEGVVGGGNLGELWCRGGPYAQSTSAPEVERGFAMVAKKGKMFPLLGWRPEEFGAGKNGDGVGQSVEEESIVGITEFLGWPEYDGCWGERLGKSVAEESGLRELGSESLIKNALGRGEARIPFLVVERIGGEQVCCNNWPKKDLYDAESAKGKRCGAGWAELLGMISLGKPKYESSEKG